MRLERWALIQSDQSPYLKRSYGLTDTGVARTQENHVRIARTLAVCEPRRALGRNQTCGHLDPELPASRPVSAAWSVAFCYGHPS